MLHLLQVGALLLLPLCLGLTFAKSALPAPPWVGIALLVLMGTLSLPPTGQRPPRLVSQLCPHPHTLHLLAQILWIHLCLYPHILPFLTPALLPPSPFLPHHHSFTAGPQLATAPSRKSTPLTQSQNCAMECRRSFSSSRAELIAFLSGNHYDLILLQETHLSSTKTFQIPDYYTLRTDRVSVDTALFPPVLITLVVVSSLSSTLTWLSLLFLSPLCFPRTPTQTTPVLKSFSPTTLLFNFLTSTPPPIRNSPSDSRTRTFYP